MDKTLRMSLLSDFYGPLLTERQQDIFEMYFHDDLSLGEISSQLSISRQAVYDILKRSAASLESFEEKLGLVAKYQEEEMLLAEIDQGLTDLLKDLEQVKLDTAVTRIQLLKQILNQIVVDS